jgi:Flp pilus assembly pilin Flp
MLNKFLINLRHNSNGNALIEYGLIAALIAVVCLGVLGSVGTKLNTTLQGVAACL